MADRAEPEAPTAETAATGDSRRRTAASADVPPGELSTEPAPAPTEPGDPGAAEAEGDPPAGADVVDLDVLADSLADLGLPAALRREAAERAVAAGRPEAARAAGTALARTLLQPVLNATGVLLPRALGGAPLAHLQGATYANLDLDLNQGTSGGRVSHAAALFARAAGAEAGLVVGSAPGALLLVATAVGWGRSVVVARPELFEDAEGVRLSELLGEAGVRVVEVGAANAVTTDDVRRAVDGGADAVLRIDPGTYRIDPDARPSIADLAAVGADAGRRPTLVVHLADGLLDARAPHLAEEPPPWLAGVTGAAQALADGADLVVLPTDRLVGGPEAGLVLGRADLVAAVAGHTLARALRPGRLVLDALQQVAMAHLAGEAGALPFWALAATAPADLEARARAVGAGTPVATTVPIGDDVLAGRTLPSWAVAIEGDHRPLLRACVPPVVAGFDGTSTLLDLRAVDPADDPALAQAAALAAQA